MCIYFSLGDIVFAVLWPPSTRTTVSGRKATCGHTILCTPTYPVHTHKRKNKQKEKGTSLTAAELQRRTHPSRCSGYIRTHMTTDKTFTHCGIVKVFIDPHLRLHFL